MCFVYHETADVYCRTIRKARTPHHCVACYGDVAAGDLYVAHSGIFDGDPFHYASCGACDLTIFRIHLHELHEGCDWNESWCSVDDLLDYCLENEFERSTRDEGQWHLRRQRDRAARKDGE